MSTTSPKRRRRWPLRLLLILVLAYLGWCAVLMFKQTDLIFPRESAGAGNTAPANRRDCERLWITADDGVRIEGWLFRSGPIKRSAPIAPTPRPCILIFHGNADLIDNMTGYADFFLSLGCHVLLVEYRGYARSGGMSRADGESAAEPSEPAIIADSLKFVDELARRPFVDATRLIYYGRSLGAGVAAQVAAKRLPAAVILESPFTSVAGMAARFGVPGFLVKYPFRTDRVLPPLASAGLPVLIMHSRADEVIPFSHAQRLQALMPSATFREITGGHNDSTISQPAFEQAIHDFFERAKITNTP